MTLVDVYEHNAKECREAAERTYNATHRAMLLKTAREWWQDAEAVRDGKARHRLLLSGKHRGNRSRGERIPALVPEPARRKLG